MPEPIINDASRELNFTNEIGYGGSVRLLKNIEVGRKMFIHLNNTNPILNEASPEHQAVRQAGWEVAEDNWQLEL